MKHLFRILAVAFAFVGFSLNAAVTASVSPAAVTNFFAGTITLQISGVAAAETVTVEKYLDRNTNGSIDAADLLMQKFNVKDGQAAVIGGVTNFNVPGDLNALAGVITSQIPFFGVEPDHLAGKYIFRVTGSSGVATAGFSVNQGTYGQSLAGTVKSSGTNVPNAFVALLDQTGEFLGGAVADAGGNYGIKAAPGTYQLAPLNPGFITSLNLPTVTLGSGTVVSINLTMFPTDRVLSGRFTDSADSSVGLPALWMFVQSPSGFATVGYADASGNFTIPVTAGQWQLRPESPPLARLGYVGPRDRQTVDASAGSVSGITITATKATALLYGSVKNSTNAPLVNLGVQADDGALLRSQSPTDGAGNYWLGIIAGNWNVGLDPDALNKLGYANSGTNVAVASGQAVRIDFVPQRVSATLSGRVLREDGSPVSSIGVGANNSTGSGSAGTGTDAGGNFTLGLSAGTWNLNLSSNEAAQQNLVGPQLQFTLIDGQTISNIVLIARTRTANVTGSVRDAAGTAVANIGISVDATVNGTNYNTYTQTDALGNYSAPVFNGSWQVNVDCFDLSQRGFSCPNQQSVTINNANAIANFVVYGPPVGKLILRFFTALGDFAGNFTPSVSYPVSVKRYQATFSVIDSNPPAIDTVSFTGPSGSGYANTPAVGGGLTPGGESLYIGPSSFPPNYAPPGNWLINYKGVTNLFNLPDPQSASRLYVPLPTISVSNDVLKSVSWSYFNANGSALGGTPPTIVSNLVEVFDLDGNFIYQSPLIPAATRSFTFDQPLAWSQVSRIRMRYLDSLTNFYFVVFTHNAATFSGSSRPSNNQFQMNLQGVAGVNYTIQYSTNLINWSNLTITNFPTSSVSFTDTSATSPYRFYRVIVGP